MKQTDRIDEEMLKDIKQLLSKKYFGNVCDNVPINLVGEIGYGIYGETIAHTAISDDVKKIIAVEINIPKKTLDEDEYLYDIIGAILHELCHAYLAISNKPFYEDTKEFRDLLAKVKAPSIFREYVSNDTIWHIFFVIKTRLSTGYYLQPSGKFSIRRWIGEKVFSFAFR